jgi:hypothetical protein
LNEAFTILKRLYIMKLRILPVCLLVGAGAFAQQAPRVFAVTDVTKGAFAWNAIREAGPQQDADALLVNDQAKGTAVSTNGKTLAQYSQANAKDLPMYSGVAALAFDESRNRLYFSTMMGRQLRYVNLGEPNKYYQVADLNQFFAKLGDRPLDHYNQGGVITRMTVADDGFGYGLSNDGNSFFRFALHQKGAVEPLGALIDAPENKVVSVHNQCSGWGGDMVAAANGDLYLFTMTQQVFKINPATRVATHLGKLKGLPAEFTINGAAVTADAEVTLSTAAYAGARAVVYNMANLETRFEKNDAFYNTSDLASSQVLFASTKAIKPVAEFAPREAGSGLVSIFPNPIVSGKAVVVFNDAKTGRYTIDLLSTAGNSVLRKSVKVTAPGQQETLVTSKLAKGFYTVRVVDADNKAQFAAKIVVQ